MSEQVEDGMGFSGFIPQKGDAEYRPCSAVRNQPTSDVSHTPGPWTAKRVSVSAGGIRIIQSGYIGGACVQAQEKAERQREANARLIAAAPELLEALLFVMRECDLDGKAIEARQMASAAIAKAREAQ